MYAVTNPFFPMKTAVKAFLCLCPVLLFGQTLKSEGDNLVITFRPAGDGSGPPVTLTAKGRIVPPGQSDPATDRKRRFVTAIVEANSSGVPGRILALWRDSDKLDIEKKLTDQKMVDANRALYSKIKVSELLAYIEYGQYQLLFVRHQGQGFTSMVRTYPVIEQEGRLLLTNALREDMVYTYLSSIFERELGKLPAK